MVVPCPCLISISGFIPQSVPCYMLQFPPASFLPARIAYIIKKAYVMKSRVMKAIWYMVVAVDSEII